MTGLLFIWKEKKVHALFFFSSKEKNHFYYPSSSISYLSSEVKITSILPVYSLSIFRVKPTVVTHFSCRCDSQSHVDPTVKQQFFNLDTVLEYSVKFTYSLFGRPEKNTLRSCDSQDNRVFPILFWGWRFPSNIDTTSFICCWLIVLHFLILLHLILMVSFSITVYNFPFLASMCRWSLILDTIPRPPSGFPSHVTQNTTTNLRPCEHWQEI